MRKLPLVVLTLLLSTPAFAATSATAPVGEPSFPLPLEGGHTGEFVGGLGFGGFTSRLNDLSDVGVSWNFRGGYNFSRYVGAELNYQGTNSDVSDRALFAGALSGTALTGQLITADLKVGFPIPIGRSGALRPYGVAGAGYGHIGVSTNIITAFPLPDEDAGAFPFAVGLSYDFTPGFVLDARYTYNVLTESAGNTWNMGFNLGARFGAR